VDANSEGVEFSGRARAALLTHANAPGGGNSAQHHAFFLAAKRRSNSRGET
jgi:hypothetical protein